MGSAGNVYKDENIKIIIDNCRKGNDRGIYKLYNIYKYILKGYIKQKGISNDNIKKVESYFLDSIKIFTKYEYGYNIIPYLYNRLEMYEENKVKKEVINELSKIENIKNESKKNEKLINREYNKYYYIILDYVFDYETHLKSDAIRYAQRLLKNSIEQIINENEIVSDMKIRKYFENFDMQFKKDLGNVEFILDDIKSGKVEYKKILIEKYLPYINEVLDEFDDNNNVKMMFLEFLNRTIDDYNKNIIKTNYTMNSFILKNIDNMKSDLLYRKDNFRYIIESINKGRLEYIYLIYDMYKEQIQIAINNSNYKKEIIYNYLKKHIYNLIISFNRNNRLENLNILKRNIENDITIIDKKYASVLDSTSKRNIRDTINRIRNGNYELIYELVKYYNHRLKVSYKYSNIENEVIDELLNKLLLVDINTYLFSEKHETGSNITKYIEYKSIYYKRYFDKYLENIKSKEIDIDSALKLSKENIENIYYIYKYYKDRINIIFDDLLPSQKHNSIYKSIAYNNLLLVIKKYILISINPNKKELDNYIYKDFDWFKDIEKEQKNK